MKKILLLLTLFSAVALGACDDFLDFGPTDVIDSNIVYESPTDINKGVLGALDAIPTGGTISLNAILMDEVKFSDENRGQNTSIWNHQISENDGEIGGFFSFYTTIDRANRVLQAMDKVRETHPDASDLLDKFQGELIGLRAYCHMMILAAYSDFQDNTALAAPYMLESSDSPTTVQPARIPVSEYVTLLKADLTQALSLLPADYVAKSRFNRYAVVATQARLALYLEEWQNAVDYSTTLINAMNLTSINNFQALWENTDSTEVIYRKPMATSSDGQIGTIFQDLNGDVFFNGSYEQYFLYDADNDIRSAVYFTIDGSKDAGNQLLVNKYDHRENQPKIGDLILFRLSEMYLTRAEANAELGNLDAAADDIEALRTQRIVDAGSVSFVTQSSALDAIYLERRKELVYEGHRFYDLKRWDLPMNRSEDDDSNELSNSLEVGDYRWLVPIPFDEMLANDNMEQNPGY